MPRFASPSMLAGVAVAALLALPEPVLAAAALTLRTVSVPEPATAALVATGLAGVAYEVRRRRGKK